MKPRYRAWLVGWVALSWAGICLLVSVLLGHAGRPWWDAAVVLLIIDAASFAVGYLFDGDLAWEERAAREQARARHPAGKGRDAA